MVLTVKKEEEQVSRDRSSAEDGRAEDLGESATTTADVIVPVDHATPPPSHLRRADPPSARPQTPSSVCALT